MLFDTHNTTNRKQDSIHSISANKNGSTTWIEASCDRCGEGSNKGRGTAYSMATAKGLDIEEGEDLVALEDLEGRDIT